MLTCSSNEQCSFPQLCFAQIDHYTGDTISSACGCPVSFAFSGQDCKQPTMATIALYVCSFVIFSSSYMVWIITSLNVWSRLQSQERSKAIALYTVIGMSYVLLGGYKLHRFYVVDDAWPGGYSIFPIDILLTFSSFVLMFPSPNNGQALQNLLTKFCTMLTVGSMYISFLIWSNLQGLDYMGIIASAALLCVSVSLPYLHPVQRRNDGDQMTVHLLHDSSKV